MSLSGIAGIAEGSLEVQWLLQCRYPALIAAYRHGASRSRTVPLAADAAPMTLVDCGVCRYGCPDCLRTRSNPLASEAWGRLCRSQPGWREPSSVT